MAKVLLTGATGFIGRHVYRALMRSDHDVYPTSSRLINLLDPADVTLLLRKTKPDCLIACAWMAIPKIFWDDPSNEAWGIHTQLLIKKFYDDGGRRCIFVSSMAAEQNLDTPYGLNKKRVEDFLAGFPNHAVARLGYPKGNAAAAEMGSKIANMVDHDQS